MMTKTSSSGSDPNEPCVICEITRENHGDSNHVFKGEDSDGLLEKKPTPEPPRQQAPRERGQASDVLGADPVARMHLRMVERMVHKGLLNGDDLMYIFGAGSADT